MPDAAVPVGGLELRALVTLDDEGQTAGVLVSGSDAPPAFAKVLRHDLLGLRLLPDSQHGPASYCLLAQFRADSNAMRLLWLPGAERNPARCLSGPMPPARELERR
jgi:hypothetical protein